MRRPRRITIPILSCAVALTGFVLCCPAPVRTQPSNSASQNDPDWRSAVILRFDPGTTSSEANRSGRYLSGITHALESGWVASIGANAISIGPLFTSGNESASEFESAAIDPELGSASEWKSLISAARRIEVPVIVIVAVPGAAPVAPTGDPDDQPRFATLARFREADGVRHFFVAGNADDISRSEVLRTGAALRRVMQESTPEGDPPWIAASLDHPSFDAVIEEVPADHLANIESLKLLYGSISDRIETDARPTILSIPLDAGSTLSGANVLLLPGAVQIAAGSVDAASADFWRSIASFRKRHPAVSMGEHTDLANNTYSFARTSVDGRYDDAVIVALGASGSTTLNVSRVFPDNAFLRDAVTGRTAFVSFGLATFAVESPGVLLIEEVR